MTNNARTGWRAVIWPNKWYGKILLIVVAAMLLQWLTLVFATDGKSATLPVTPGVVITDPAKITVSTAQADVAATLDNAPSQAVLDKLIAVGNPTEVGTDLAVANTLDPVTLLPAAIPATVSGTTVAGCHGTIIRTVKVYIFVGVVLAWRQVIQTQWCWNSEKIYYRGNSEGHKFLRGSYCWQGESFSNTGWVYGPKPGQVITYKLSYPGVLYSSFPQCAINPFTRSLNPRLYYSRGGTWQNGDGKIHH